MKMNEKVSASGEGTSPPLCPWTPLEALSQTSTLAIVPRWQILDAPLAGRYLSGNPGGLQGRFYVGAEGHMPPPRFTCCSLQQVQKLAGTM